MPSKHKKMTKLECIQYEKSLFKKSVFREDMRVVAYAHHPKIKDINLFDLVLDLEDILHTTKGQKDLIKFMRHYPAYAEVLFELIFSLSLNQGISSYRLPLAERMHLALQLLSEGPALKKIMNNDPETFKRCFKYLATFVEYVNEHQQTGAVLYGPDFEALDHNGFSTNRNFSEPLPFGSYSAPIAEFRYDIPKEESETLHKQMSYYAHIVYESMRNRIVIAPNVKKMAMYLDYLSIAFSLRVNQDIASEILNGKENLIGEFVHKNETRSLYILLTYLNVALDTCERAQLNSMLTDYFLDAVHEQSYGIALILLQYMPFSEELGNQLVNEFYNLPEDSEERAFYINKYIDVLNTKEMTPEIFYHLQQILNDERNRDIFPTPNVQLYHGLYKELSHLESHIGRHIYRKRFQKGYAQLQTSMDFVFQQGSILSVTEITNSAESKEKPSIKKAAANFGIMYNEDLTNINRGCGYHNAKEIVKKHVAIYKKLEKKSGKIAKHKTKLATTESSPKKMKISSLGFFKSLNMRSATNSSQHVRATVI